MLPGPSESKWTLKFHPWESDCILPDQPGVLSNPEQDLDGYKKKMTWRGNVWLELEHRSATCWSAASELVEGDLTKPRTQMQHRRWKGRHEDSDIATSAPAPATAETRTRGSNRDFTGAAHWFDRFLFKQGQWTSEPWLLDLTSKKVLPEDIERESEWFDLPSAQPLCVENSSSETVDNEPAAVLGARETAGGQSKVPAGGVGAANVDAVSASKNNGTTQISEVQPDLLSWSQSHKLERERIRKDDTLERERDRKEDEKRWEKIAEMLTNQFKSDVDK
jgi:hypothetical protein